MAGASYQRNAPGATDVYQGIEDLGHGPFSTQQAEHHHASIFHCAQQSVTGVLSIQGNGVERLYLRGTGQGQTSQGTVCGKNIRIGSGNEDDSLLTDFPFSRQICPALPG
jgi:hypothetical protein